MFRPNNSSSSLQDLDYAEAKDNEGLLENYNQSIATYKRKSQSDLIYLAIHIVLLSLAATMFIYSSSRLNQASLMTSTHQYSHSPLDNSVGEARRQLRGEFEHQTIFKGEPSPGLDEAWEKISNAAIISIDKDVFPHLNKTSDTAAKLPETQGGGYAASLEVFHQLHCLNMIRKFTYLDYYRDELRQNNPSIEVLEHHKDHCIDILRQFIMCSGDTGLITYTWEKDRRVPMPDFSTTKVCRNFDDIVNWVSDNEVLSL